MKNYVITIARGFGSGGKDIGNRLSDALGIPVYEKQILEMASEQSGLSVELFKNVDEKLKGSYLRKKLQGYPSTNYIVEATEKNFISDVNIYNIQASIIRNLANTQSCIIIGKCADVVLKHFNNVVSIYVEAPRDVCVQSIMEKMDVTEQEANRMIYHTDKYRAEYYKYYSGGGDWTNPTNYDLTLNTGRISRENCVELIKEYLKIKGFI
ncbi:MAG: cytidylate kinase family protein [Clostridiales bacterium]|nr:cytidylate kinase family protein [Clostridiales bacterium]